MAASSNVAYGEVVYHPTGLPMYAGYKIDLLTTDMTITVPDTPGINNNMAAFVPVYSRVQPDLAPNDAYSVVSLLLSGVPQFSIIFETIDAASGLYDTIYSGYHMFDINNIITNNIVEDGGVRYQMPHDSSKNGEGYTEKRYFVQLVSTTPTTNWRIHTVTRSSYEYSIDPTWSGSPGTPPPSMTGTFVEEKDLTW
jgi:hypothetical protein